MSTITTVNENVDVTYSDPGFVVRHFTDLILQFAFLMLELCHQTGNVLLRETSRQVGKIN